MRHAGFTLIEVIVALAILGLIGLGTTSVLTSVIDANELSEQRLAQLETLQRAMMTIERDILQATPRNLRVNYEENKNVMSGGQDVAQSEADGIIFVRGGRHNPQYRLHRSTLQGVAYRLKEGNLERLYGNYVDNSSGYEPKVRVLLEDVEDLDIQFYNKPAGKLDESAAWNDKYESGELPLAVAITIESNIFGEVRREFVLSAGTPSS